MMRKIYITMFALANIMSATAQDTYESGRLLGSDLNGTARYVGMGGAMDALGADISTISTNPAGIGVFRHSTASVSFGFVSQQDARKFDGLSKTNMSFDQAGFVYSARINRNSYINFSFNYHKSRNFDQILSAANSLRGCSQNSLAYYKCGLGSVTKGGYEFIDYTEFYSPENADFGDVIGYDGKYRANTYSEFDYLNVNVLMADPYQYAENNPFIFANDANQYTFDRAHRGWIANYDINISGNSNDRFYWGITAGIKDVRYNGYSEYGETLIDSQGECGSVVYGDSRKIKGTGLDLTFGIIVRPIEDSPFRFGASVATPTWYDLTTTNETVMLNNSLYGYFDEGSTNSSYDFKFFTPWKFGLSLGHTIGTQLALGFGYEYSDYSASKNRVNKSGSYWYDGAYGYSPSFNDEAMKSNTEKSMKGVHTLKAGVEFKPVPEMAVRFGYNYVSSPYEENGMRDMTLNSLGVAYSSTTDYVNWKDTHRVTCGLGYKSGGLNVDVAYQYNTTKGDFHPFQPYEGDTGVTEVDNNRHQLLLTLGYTF